eukprot:TRINITY_DN58775_c0_g1_i1.p2 TRINITY_DN58775_c0_g1~~TRINITY_DN58775_c0_g1_i1.p2  ORF type:complete len:147 (+),score=21.64 TRINITY_DN58775_c0_g1_i1:333-773(+)
MWNGEHNICRQTRNYPGVVRATLGYTGGSNPNPSYESVSEGDGHTEALRIEYEESQTTYEDLLVFFWKHYDGSDPDPQYKSAIWVQDEAQRRAAEDSIEGVAALLKKKKIRKAKVEILDAGPWYDAEDYHQKHLRTVTEHRGIAKG